MRWHGVKIEVVAVALVVALSAFWGTQWLYHNLNLQKPLREKLEHNQLVAHYEIEKSNNNYNITVTPRQTDNLMVAYHQLYNDLEQVMGNKIFTIQINNQHHDQLDRIYHRGQFAIYEALATGNFTRMEETLHGYARGAGVDSQVFMDDQNIYWQLSVGSDFRYDVVGKNKDSSQAPLNVAKGR